MEEIEEGMSAVETIEELFEKMREEFGEFDEKSRKVDTLQVLVQGTKTYNEYVQKFKRTARGSVMPLFYFCFFFIVVGDTHVVLMLCFCSWYLSSFIFL